jgi:hypothetical protein
MKSSTLLMIAAGAAVLYYVTRPGFALASPGTRPATTSATPGTTARSKIEAAAEAAGSRLAVSAIGSVADKLTSYFDRNPVGIGGQVTSNMSTGGFDESYGLYNF